MLFKYIDGRAGSGKTTHICQRATDLALSGEKVLILQTTRDLVDRTVRKFQKVPYLKVRAIHTRTQQAPVATTLTQHIQQTGSGGEVLLITHEGFDRQRFWPCRSNWNLICDETPKAVIEHDHNIPASHAIITRFLATEPHDARYSALRCTDETAIAAVARNQEGDKFHAELQPLANALLDEHWATYVLTTGYDALLQGRGAERKLTAYSVRKPSSFGGFKSALFLGARFTESFFYYAMVAQGVQFEQVATNQPVSETRHPNGHAIAISFAFDENWSLNRRNKHDGELMDAFVNGIATEFKDDTFLWMANVDQANILFARCQKAQRLPNSPHGLNDYRHVHNVAILSALNPKPGHHRFLMDQLGMTEDQIRTAFTYHVIYQAVMRSSARDPHNLVPKTFIVPDQSTAHWLGAVLDTALVTQLDLSIPERPKKQPGRPGQYKSNAEKQRAYRERLAALRRAGTFSP